MYILVLGYVPCAPVTPARTGFISQHGKASGGWFLPRPKIHHCDCGPLIEADVFAFLIKWWIIRVRMKSRAIALRNERQAMVNCQAEDLVLVILRGAYNGHSFRQHELITAMRVKIHTGHEGSLRWVGMYPANGV